MKFSKSIIISVVVHGIAFAFVPEFFKGWEQENWIEVSVVAFPDTVEKIPQWSPGKKTVPLPKHEVREMQKNELPLFAEESEIGIPVEASEPDYEDLEMDMEDLAEYDILEKTEVGRDEKKGEMEDEGDSDSFVIAGPVAFRKVIRSRKPKYPAWAEERGIEGEVDLKFWVTPEGYVSKVEMERTSGYPDLDSRAIESVKFYLFSPLGKNEAQDMQWGRITIKYTLK